MRISFVSAYQEKEFNISMCNYLFLKILLEKKLCLSVGLEWEMKPSEKQNEC